MEPPAARPSGRLASLVVGAAAALSRLLGFARDVGLAVLFGAGPVGDALLIALRLPNLVRRVLSEGGLHTAFVPVMLGEQANQGEDAARRFAGQVILFLALLFGLLAVLVQLLALPLVLLLGTPAQTADLAALALVLAFPMVAGSGLAAVASAILATQHKFALAAWSGVLVNLLLVLALVWLNLHPGESTQAVIALAGLSGASGLVQGLVLLLVVRISDVAPRWTRPRWTPAMRRFVTLCVPGMVIAAGSQLAFLILISQAGQFSGLVSQLYFADRVTQLPFGFIAAVLAIVVLPAISRDALASDQTAFGRGMDRAMLLSLLLALPASGGLILLADPVSHVLFEHGAFDHTAQQATRDALAGCALALPALAVGRVSAHGFFAHGRIKEPLTATLAGLAGVLVICLVLRQNGQADARSFALSLSAGAGIEMLAGLGFLLVRLGWRPERALLRDLVLVLLATALMLAGVNIIALLIDPMMPVQPALEAEILSLLGKCLGGCAVYGLCVSAFGLLKPHHEMPTG